MVSNDFPTHYWKKSCTHRTVFGKFAVVYARTRFFNIFKFLKSRTVKCASFSLLRNLITRLQLKFLPKLRTNFRGRPAANCTLMADSIPVAQPISLQHLHEYASRILLIKIIFKHFLNSQQCRTSCSNDCFSILDHASTTFQLKIKEAIHIQRDKPTLNQLYHVNLKLSL